MKATLERWLLARWYGGRTPEFWLRLVAAIYGGLVWARAALYRHAWLPSVTLPVPVIIVGNFTVGGTGKTPTLIALVEHLSAKGWKPGVVSRGYGRIGGGPQAVITGSSAVVVGDEPLLIARRTGVPVQVDSDRVRAAAALVDAGCNLILADDGLQHRRLARDIEIEVRDSERGLGNGRMLPAGPLREPVRPVDFCIVNGGGAIEAWPMQLQLGEPRSLEGDCVRAMAQFNDRPVHAIAGIGHPARFFQALRNAGIEVVEHAFPDHHRYCVKDLADLPRPLLMTEKDAVKCAGLGLSDAWFVPVTTQLSPAFYNALDLRIEPLRKKPSP